MAAGTSYPGLVARSGLNPERPLVAAFYICVYSLLLFSPALMEGRIKAKLGWFMGGALITLVVILAGVRVVQPGPLKAVLDRVFAQGISQTIAASIVAGIGSVALAQVVRALYQRRDAILRSPIVMLSILVVVFFVAEQIAIGGNIPFYERYLLQIMPFLGIIRAATIPRLTVADLAIWFGMAGVGQVALWRYF